MAETAQKNMLNQLADRDREIVKMPDTLEGMEVRASKAERQVVRLHSAEKESDTYRSGCTRQRRRVTRTDS